MMKVLNRGHGYVAILDITDKCSYKCSCDHVAEISKTLTLRPRGPQFKTLTMIFMLT